LPFLQVSEAVVDSWVIKGARDDSASCKKDILMKSLWKNYRTRVEERVKGGEEEAV